MKKLTVLICALALFSCQTPKSVCDNLTGPSLLCSLSDKAGVRLETVGDLIMVVNLRAIKHGAYTAEAAANVLYAFKPFLEPGMAASELKHLILSNAGEFPELILVTPYISLLETSDTLTVADIGMLEFWVDQQIRMVARY